MPIIRPDSDSSIVNWTTQTGSGANLYQSIDEITADDADFVQSDTSAINTEYCRTTLENVNDPQTSQSHTLRYRYRKDQALGRIIAINIRLLQGVSAIIAERDHANVSPNWTQAEYTLTSTEADSITDYNDLRFQVTAVQTGGGAARRGQLSWFEMVVPIATAYITKNISIKGIATSIYITRNIGIKGKNTLFKTVGISIKGSVIISGVVKNYDNSAIENATVKYITEVTSQVTTDSNGLYSFQCSSSNATVWTEWNNWHFDTDPTLATPADFYSLTGISTSQPNKDFKIRDIKDTQWYNRNFIGRYPIVFSTGHSLYKKDDIVELTVNLGNHKKIATDGAYNSSIQEMQNCIVTYANKTHIIYLAIDTVSGLVIRTKYYDELTEEWSESSLVDTVGGSDTHHFPSMTIDNDGYFVATYRWHNGLGFFKRSLNPGDSTQWGSRITMVSPRAGTYPRIFVSNFNRIYIFLRITRPGSDHRYIGYIYSDNNGSTWSPIYFVVRSTLTSGSGGNALYPFGVTYYRAYKEPLKSLGATKDRVMIVFSEREYYGSWYNQKHCIFAQGDIENDTNGSSNWRKANGTLYGNGGQPSTDYTQAPVQNTNYEYVYQSGDFCVPMDVAIDSKGRIYAAYQRYDDNTKAYRGHVNGWIRKFNSSGAWQTSVQVFSESRHSLGGSMHIDWNDYIYVLNNSDLSGNVTLDISSNSAQSFRRQLLSGGNNIRGWRSVFRYDNDIKRIDAAISYDEDIYLLSMQPGFDWLGDTKNIHMTYNSQQIDRHIVDLHGSLDNIVRFKLQSSIPLNKQTDLFKGYALYVSNETMSSAFNNYNNIYKFYDNFEVPSSLASTNVGLSTYNGWQVSAANKFWIESNSTIGMKM